MSKKLQAVLSTQERLNNYLGLAQRAEKVAAGDAAAQDALGKGKACLLVLAADAAKTVQEEMLHLAGDKVPVLFWPDKASLGLAVGKSPRGAVAVLDYGFAQAMLKTAQNS